MTGRINATRKTVHLLPLAPTPMLWLEPSSANALLQHYTYSLSTVNFLNEDDTNPSMSLAGKESAIFPKLFWVFGMAMTLWPLIKTTAKLPWVHCPIVPRFALCPCRRPFKQEPCSDTSGFLTTSVICLSESVQPETFIFPVHWQPPIFPYPHLCFLEAQLNPVPLPYKTLSQWS